MRSPNGSDRAVDDLADRFFEGVLERDPISATRLGDVRWNDRLPDLGDSGRAAEASACRDVMSAATAIEAHHLGPEPALTRDMLILLAQNRLEALEQRQYQLAVDHMSGVQNMPMEIAHYHVADTPEQLGALLARFAAYPAAIEQHIATLREGLSDQRTSALDAVRKTVEQIGKVLTMSPSPPVAIARVADEAARDRVRRAVEIHVNPALQALHDFLVHEYRPQARLEPGLHSTPNGEAAYDVAIRAQTTLSATADEIHRFGIEEVQRIESEMDELSGWLGHPDRNALRRSLADDPVNRATSSQQLLDLASDRIRRAEAAARRSFGRVPHAGCVAKPVEAYREQYVTTFYVEPTADGSRPGEVYLNTYELAAMPLHMLASLVFHEATPGHHLQAAIGAELGGLPRLRTQASAIVPQMGGADRRGGPPLMGAGFIEGWGLYAERLADEMGLYASQAERQGMLEFQLLRALRLVADSGLHAKGWSRQQTIDFLHGRRGGAPRVISESEVDRYTIWPGQALAYKLGQREIERLRREISQKLGGRFDVRTFHDELLSLGAIPLSILRRELPARVETAIFSASERRD